MPNFAANLSMMYTEVPFLDRFALAAQDGFSAVEYLFPYAWSAKDLSSRLRDNGLQQVLMNAPPGGVAPPAMDLAWGQGVRGISALPAHKAEFREGFHLALEYAQVLGCPRVHVMAGLIPQEDRTSALGVPDTQHAALRSSSNAIRANTRMRACYLDNLQWACEQAQPLGLDILIEPINARDIAHYFLNRQGDAHDIVLELGCTNLKVQMDLYHAQIVEGDLISKIKEYLPTGRVAHFQIAGVPNRREPSDGELHYPSIFACIDQISEACAWSGWVGCEYNPAKGTQSGGTSQGLGWLRAYQSAKATGNN